MGIGMNGRLWVKTSNTDEWTASFDEWKAPSRVFFPCQMGIFMNIPCGIYVMENDDHFFLRDRERQDPKSRY
jgi:hypothetical protein